MKYAKGGKILRSTEELTRGSQNLRMKLTEIRGVGEVIATPSGACSQGLSYNI